MTLVEYTPPTSAGGNVWVELVKPAAELASQIANTDFVPAEMRNKPAVVAACILYGAEIGIGPMQSLAKVDIVKGRPAPKAELARALALAAGHDIRVLESTNTKCTVSGRRAGSDHTQTVTWTMDDVKKAGISNPAYSKYPRQMLLARASAELVRAMCPDVLGGISLFSEEAGDGDDTSPVVATASAPVQATTRRKRAPIAELPAAELPPLPTDDEPIETTADEAAPDDAVEMITEPQIKKMMAEFNDLGVRAKEDRIAYICEKIGRTVESSKELTKAEASRVIDSFTPPSEEP